VPQSRLLSPGNNSSSILSPESLELTRDANAAAAAAAAAGCASPSAARSGIRVRQDLMQHLGLVARSSANIVQGADSRGQQRGAQQPTSQQLLQISAVGGGGGASAAAAAPAAVIPPSLQLSTVKLPPSVVMAQPVHAQQQQQTGATAGSAAAVSAAAVSATPNLAKLLSESIGSSSDTLSAGAAAGLTTPPVGHRSSNAQLFKSSESSSGTAIPLTFNNSIAEVLAAAASKAKGLNNMSREPSPKPEITITAKSAAGMSGRQFTSLGGGGPTAAKFSVLKQAKTTPSSSLGMGSSSGGGIVTVTSSSGGTSFIGSSGSLSILKRPIGGGSVTTTESGGGGVNPISNMTKLLQAQAPGLPPHIIAQQALPSRSSPKVKASFSFIITYRYCTGCRIVPEPVPAVLAEYRTATVLSFKKQLFLTLLIRVSVFQISTGNIKE
jgi:hypothetical protein